MVFIMSEKEKSYFNNLSVIMQFSKVSRCWNEKLIYYFFKFVFEKYKWKSPHLWFEKVSLQSTKLLQAFLKFHLFPVQQISRPEVTFYWWDKFGMIWN